MSNVLSQEEVDSLLKGVTSGEIETETEEEVTSDGVMPYDFTRQEQMLRGRLPTLGVINDRFAANFRDSLSGMIRKSVDVEADPVDMVKFENFRSSLPVPTSLHVFRMDPLGGQALFVFDSHFVFGLIEYYFGGRGRTSAKIEGRDFTQIENTMIGKVVSRCLNDLASAWEKVFPVDIVYARSEINPEFAGIVLPGDSVIVTQFRVDIEGVGGGLSLCVPYSTIEPVRDRLSGGVQRDNLRSDAKWRQRLKERIRAASVDIVVELGSTQVTTERLLQLKTGDVIQLEQRVGEPLAASVQGVQKLMGRPGVIKGNRALKLNRIGVNG
jgi:flagellar motor switch protein FliM